MIWCGEKEYASRCNQLQGGYMLYYYVRRGLRGLSLLFKQQCSGKRHAGYALEWCQHRAFHEGACVNARGEEF